MRCCAAWVAVRAKWKNSYGLIAPFTPCAPQEGAENWVATLASTLTGAGSRLADWLVVHCATAGFAFLTPVSIYRARWCNPVDAATLDAASAAAGAGVDALRVMTLTRPPTFWLYTPSGRRAEHGG